MNNDKDNATFYMLLAESRTFYDRSDFPAS